ncbi:ABC transporter permease [Pedobacter duraquae]|uniref:ABC-type lipoprotein release transport system permease subunit n=1 Tax=Pedobacter duraquae TaxID=425511 RepID=A0A4R6IR21_9SPHI|nr:ABC transporter permease [Pedobacter duraquae]TDO24850.1 ABC-type lipoprotein release transport system permease subunit [Pedobacter duraquae]
MFQLNFKIAWRNLWRNRSYTLINILGLSIGMAACMLIFLFISYQLHFDSNFQNSDRIYRFVTTWKYPGYDDFSKGIPLPLAGAVKNDLAGIDKSAVIIKRGGIIHVKDGAGTETFKSRVAFYYAEPEFFEIFSWGWLKGNPKMALSAPNTVALSASTAIQYFGNTENAIGKSLSIGNTINLKVTGVFEDAPVNSSFPLKIVISYTTFNSAKYVNWDGVNSAMEYYVLLKDGLNAVDMTQPVADFNKRHYDDTKILGHQRNILQSLNDIHFDQKYGSFAETSVSKKEIYGLGIIGLFLIFTACINFINLATAQAANRSKEVGVRKVMGGSRSQLVVQFLMETFVITCLSMLVGSVITELVIPGMSDLLNIHFSFFSEPRVYLFMLAMVLIVSLLAGFYPAMIISGYSPALAIKNKITVNAGALGLRRVLVVLQFAITIILLISTLFIMQQMAYVRDKPLGFNADAVAMLGLPSDSLSQSRYNTFKQRATQIPGVSMLSLCQAPPSSDNITTSDFSYKGKRNQDFELRQAKADDNYFDVFDLHIIAGKKFGKNAEQDFAVVNETFVRKMGISDPQAVIGQILNTNGHDMVITGVVKDFNDLSLKENISPLVIYPQESDYYAVAVKLSGSEIMPAMKKLESLWNSTFPEYVYNSSFLKEDLNGFYESERLMGMLFKIAEGVIVFISLIGLFGLISFVAAQRTREVAIRKVLGASSVELVRLLNSSFINMVFIANFVAWPLAYLFVSRWLETFAYRIELSVWPFVYAFIVSMGITVLTVSLKSYKTATANTIDALKYE